MGTITGIARHARPKGAMETIDHAEVTLDCGIVGDFRGAMRAKPYKRQVTLIEAQDWEAAMAEVGHSLPWYERRCNLLVTGFDLPQTRGSRIRIGADVVLEVTVETEPCERMEALAEGLRGALMTDWRGGACTMVIAPGHIAIGDSIRMDT